MMNSNHLAIAATILFALTTTGCLSESTSTGKVAIADADNLIATQQENKPEDKQDSPHNESTVSDESAEPMAPAEQNSSDGPRATNIKPTSEVTPDQQSKDLPSLKESLENPVVQDAGNEEEKLTETPQTITIPDTWKRLSKKHEIWVDVQAKKVIAAGHVCMRAGPLEVFACPQGTKEHESVVSLNALGSQIHAALLAIGAEPGHPVKWQEKYEAATGPVINIDVIWSSDDKQQRCRAQDLVTNVKTGKPMEENWVFGGSAAFTDEESGETYYYGDSGELVCLSNFSTATMDVPVKSSDANEGLLFQANTDNIPEFNTKVYLVFKPEIPNK